MTEPFAPQVLDLLPHRPPMRLIDGVLSVQDTACEVRSVIGPDHLFLRADGTLAPEAFCEMIAQGYAIGEALRRQRAGLSTNGGGYLASIRNLDVHALARQGDELHTQVTIQEDFDNMRIAAGTVRRGETCLATAVVYIYLWENNPL